MYKVDLPVDSSAEAAVERRRAAETGRQARIFNTRNRVMGLDLPTLERQVAERKDREEMEGQRERAFDMLRVTQDGMLLQQQQEEKQMRAELNRDLVRYRAIQQRVEDSRDADLNVDRKGAVELSIPIPECEFGPASMQVFQGEGIGEDEKRRAQMEQTERTLRAQREETERRHKERKHKEMLLGRELVQQDLWAVQLDGLEEECKRAVRIALNNYNHAQAAERAEQQSLERTRREGEELSEVWHSVTSDMLTECPEAAERGGGGPGAPRVLTDRWRGMSGEQLSAIRRQREEQRAEREREREIEKQRDLAWDFQRMELTREGEEEEKKATELRKETRIQMDKYNDQLAREQRKHQEYLKKQLYTNKPTAHYFTQFNSSSR